MNNDTAELSPIAPYMAIGSPAIVHGIGARDHIAQPRHDRGDHPRRGLDHRHQPARKTHLSGPRRALTGFTDEIFDLPHAHRTRELSIGIPGPETDRLAAHVRLDDTYIVVRCKARRHVVAYCGQVIGQERSGVNVISTAPVDIEALCRHRLMNGNSNRLKDIHTELFRRMYARPIHPAGLWLDREPGRHAEVDDVYRANIERLVQQHTYTGSVQRYYRALAEAGTVETHLVISHGARRCIQLETGLSVGDVAAFADVVHNPADLAASISSGSFRTMGMAVVPCSARTLAAVATGNSDNLLTRAAAVTLKERRPLVLAVRETPLSLIHIRNMKTVTLAGATVLPPVPAFYHGPRTVDDILRQTGHGVSAHPDGGELQTRPPAGQAPRRQGRRTGSGQRHGRGGVHRHSHRRTAAADRRRHLVRRDR